MKIAHVVCVFPPYKGGMGNSAYHFAKILSSMGHEVVIFTTDYGNLNIEEKNDFKVERLKPFFKIGNAAILPQLFWKLKGFDIIHLHYPFFGSVEVVLLGKFLSFKNANIVVHYHMDAVGTGIKGIIFNINRFLFLPLLIRKAKIITCASLDYIKHSHLSKYYRKREQQFRQTLFGVDSSVFAPRGDNGEKKEKTILFVGGLDKAHYFKGLKNLLIAIKILKKELSFPIKLNVVGKGDLKPYYENLTRKLRILDEVNFFDNVENKDLPKYYNDCDVFVLPSINRGEAFGLVLLEAMASGKPVVASGLPGVRGVFKSGEQGLVVKPDDINDLVEKIKKILLDKNMAKKMGEAGRELVEKKYTWEEVGKRLDLIYHHANYIPDDVL